MHLETLAYGHSLLHRLDPRAKLVAALAYSLVIALVQVRLVLWTGLGVSLAVVLLARLRPSEVAKRILAVNIFMVMLWLLLPWQVEFHAGLKGLAISHSQRGQDMALIITLKGNSMVLALLALLATSSVHQMFHALAHWRAPEKLLEIFFLFYRYLYVLHREYHRLNWGLKARGFAPGSNIHTYRTYAHIIGMLLVRSFDRAERVYQAMLCRGFNGTYWLLDHFNWQRRDSLFLTAWLAFILGLVYWGRFVS